MASDRIPATAVPPAGGNAADSGARARGINRTARLLSQPAKPQRVCVDCGLVVGSSAVRWPLSVAGDIRRAGVGENCPLEAAQVFGRSQCRTGAGTCARGARPDARLRQSLRPALLALGCALPARERRQLRCAATLAANWQSGRFVFGVEADASAVDLEGNVPCIEAGCNTTAVKTSRSEPSQGAFDRPAKPGRRIHDERAMQRQDSGR